MGVDVAVCVGVGLGLGVVVDGGVTVGVGLSGSVGVDGRTAVGADVGEWVAIGMKGRLHEESRVNAKRKNTLFFFIRISLVRNRLLIDLGHLPGVCESCCDRNISATAPVIILFRA